MALAATACSSTKKSPTASSSPAAGKVVTIALGGPFSGSEKPTGDQIRSGAKLAADEINAAGGITAGAFKGDHIAFREFDDADTPATAASNMRAVVDDDSLIAFVGSGLSDASVAAAPVASEAGIAYLAAYASSPKILEAATAKKSVFVVPPTFPAYAFSVTDELLKAGRRRAALIHLSGTYGDGVAKYVTQRLTDKGAAVVDEESFGFTDKDFRTQVAKAKAKNPDSLVIVGLADSDALILKAADQVGLKVPVYDPGGITNSDSFLKDAGPLAEGLVGNSPSDAQRNTPPAQSLRSAYSKATSQSVVPDPAAFSYEAVKAVAAALAGGATNRHDLANALHHINLADTGVGPLAFSEDGTRVGGRLYVFTVKNGKPVFSGGYEQTGPTEIKAVALDR